MEDEDLGEDQDDDRDERRDPDPGRHDVSRYGPTNRWQSGQMSRFARFARVCGQSPAGCLPLAPRAVGDRSALAAFPAGGVCLAKRST